jgi:outer membrane protein assembly factor BamA
VRCCLALFAIACGAQPRVHSADDDYLRAIRVVGNRAIDSAELEPALGLREALRDGVAIDPIVLATDVNRLTAAYRKRGYFAVKVTARVERDGHAQVAVFTIDEGRRAATRVEITGLPPEVPAAEARALVSLRDGDPFDYGAYDAAKAPLLARVEDAGYAHVEIHATATGDAGAALAIARYAVDAGPRCTFGAIRFTGSAQPDLLAAVRARIGFAAGDRYSLSALAATQTEIYDLGRFSTVQVVPDRVSVGPVIGVTITLAEANRHEFHVGGGGGLDLETWEVRGRLGYSVVPEWQPLLTAAADARVALTTRRDTGERQPKVRGQLSVQRIDLGWPRIRGDAEIGADYQKVEAYAWKGGHARLGLGAPLGWRALQLRVGWRLDYLVFSDLDPAFGAPEEQCPAPACTGGTCTKAQELGLCESQWLGAYQASLVADLRDNPIEPHRGVYLDIRAAVGTPLAGGELRYVQVTPELRGYVSLGELIVAARARYGAIFSHISDIPVTQRYYSGGTVGQRGFAERQLSPMVCDPAAPCQVIGGAGLIETGIELRRRLGSLWSVPVGANVFLDGADVTELPEQLLSRNLYWAAGVGVWGKAFGALKIRVDVGYRLNRTQMDALATSGTLANLAPHFAVGEDY